MPLFLKDENCSHCWQRNCIPNAAWPETKDVNNKVFMLQVGWDVCLFLENSIEDMM